MSDRPAHPLAPHVQAAITAGRGVGVQAQTCTIPGGVAGRVAAVHVQRAVGGVGAASVQRAWKAATGPKAGTPAWFQKITAEVDKAVQDGWPVVVSENAQKHFKEGAADAFNQAKASNSGIFYESVDGNASVTFKIDQNKSVGIRLDRIETKIVIVHYGPGAISGFQLPPGQAAPSW